MAWRVRDRRHSAMWPPTSSPSSPSTIFAEPLSSRPPEGACSRRNPCRSPPAVIPPVMNHARSHFRRGIPSRGRADETIAIAATTLLADAAGAIYWPDEKLLIVADLHLEKGSAFAARGVL